MPDSRVRRTIIVRICLAIVLAFMLPGRDGRAASNAQSSPEQDSVSTERLFSPLHSTTTLTGFHCDAVSTPSQSAFAADPDYREAPFTVGVEMVLEEVSALGAPPATGQMDDASAADVRTPLSAKVSRMLTHQEMPAGPGEGGMEDVFLPEASMAIADLVALCTP
jgi:hypothetical protein